MAQAIRTSSAIKGIPIADKEIKVSLFADDVILFLTDPVSSLLVYLLLLIFTVTGFQFYFRVESQY